MSRESGLLRVKRPGMLCRRSDICTHARSCVEQNLKMSPWPSPPGVTPVNVWQKGNYPCEPNLIT